MCGCNNSMVENFLIKKKQGAWNLLRGRIFAQIRHYDRSNFYLYTRFFIRMVIFSFEAKHSYICSENESQIFVLKKRNFNH